MPDFPVIAALLATGALMTTTPQERSVTHPVRLEVADAGVDKVNLRIVAGSPAPVTARYTLSVDTGRGNRSTQGGVVTTRPGTPVTVMDLTVSTGSPPRWRATLSVEPDGGERYTVERASE